MTTGTVVDGKVVVRGESLKEGSQVTVLVPEPSGEQSFELGPQDEAALLESIREADAGQLIEGDESLHQNLVQQAKTEGISLNQMIVYILTRMTSGADLDEQRGAFEGLLHHYPAAEAETASQQILATRTPEDHVRR